MSDIALDANGDLDISGGDFRLLTNGEAIAQHLRIRLRFFKGEYFANLDVGVPYFDRVFIKQASNEALTSIFREVILSTEGVIRLDTLTFAFDRASREVSVRFKAIITGEEVLEFTDNFVIGD